MWKHVLNSRNLHLPFDRSVFGTYEMTSQRLTRFFHVSNGFRQYATKTKVDIDPTFIKTGKKMSWRKHPGQTQPRKVVKLPQAIEDTIMKILKEQNYTSLIKRGVSFIRHLHGRHAPLEDSEKESLAKSEDFKIQQQLLKKKPGLEPEEYAKLVEKGQSSLLLRTKVKMNLWKPVQYDDQKCFQYLLIRGTADYAVLKVIFSEIASRDPDFQPRSLLDFGSGVGTVTWAAQQLWEKCKEFYNVDISTSMRDLASLVLKGGNHQTELSPSIFFKGFLPVSLHYTHDIVVSAYSLLELPSRKQRLETLLSLWNKTDSYLVIVEEGTYAGYKLVVEARDFILEMAEKEQGVAGETGAHVFAPCAHDRACPKFLTSRYPCNFEVSYLAHPCVESSQAMRERYSYVVLKRGARNPYVTEWPRIVEDIKTRNRHCIARLCTPAGGLSEIVVSKAKNADGSYALVKSSKWGDTIPLILTENERDELSSKERYRLKMLGMNGMQEQKGEAEDDNSISEKQGNS